MLKESGGGWLKKSITHKNIMGIDPGTKKLGIAILYHNIGQPNGALEIRHFEDQNYEYKLLVFKEKRTILNFLLEIESEIVELITKFNVEEVIIEKMFISYNNSNSALLNLIPRFLKESIDKLDKGILIKETATTTVKKQVCGSGRADKKAVKKAVEEKLGIETYDTNIADAFALILGGIK